MSHLAIFKTHYPTNHIEIPGIQTKHKNKNETPTCCSYDEVDFKRDHSLIVGVNDWLESWEGGGVTGSRIILAIGPKYSFYWCWFDDSRQKTELIWTTVYWSDLPFQQHKFVNSIELSIGYFSRTPIATNAVVSLVNWLFKSWVVFVWFSITMPMVGKGWTVHPWDE